MSTSTNKGLVRRYYEEVVSAGKVERIADFIAPEYTEVYRNVRYPVGIEGARDHVLGVRRTYPDLCLSVGQQIAEGEWVVTQVTMRGTHRGEWLGMTPTGKAVELTAVNVDRVVAGRIVEHGGAANLLEPLLGIGAIRVVGPGAPTEEAVGRAGDGFVAFRPRYLTLQGHLELDGDPDENFPLFSPVGETLWVPGWSPELLHPAGVEWAEGQIFRTREDTGEEVVWIVTRLDREAHRVEYRRVVPRLHVATVEIGCRGAGDRRTRVDVSYAYVGLSDAGNRAIASMTQPEYDQKMARWKLWIEERVASAGTPPPGAIS